MAERSQNLQLFLTNFKYLCASSFSGFVARYAAVKARE
jgi:hypothetical protein